MRLVAVMATARVSERSGECGEGKGKQTAVARQPRRSHVTMTGEEKEGASPSPTLHPAGFTFAPVPSLRCNYVGSRSAGATARDKNFFFVLLTLEVAL